MSPNTIRIWSSLVASSRFREVCYCSAFQSSQKFLYQNCFFSAS